MNEALNFRAMQDQIVLAALPHVPFEGWSRRALIEASKDAGFDPDAAQRAFPAGPVAAVEHLALLADQRLLDEAAAQAWLWWRWCTASRL